MTYQFDGYNYIIRLERGEEIVNKVTTFVKEKAIRGGWINGLGGAERAELGYFDLEAQEYKWKTFNNLVEITSLEGNVAWQNDEPILHLHGTFTDREYNAIGGHVKTAITGGTCELFLHSRFGDEKLRRAKDKSTGLNLLDL
jgi:uncharacterized protein